MKFILKVLVCGIGAVSCLYSQINLIKNPSFEEKICHNNNKPMIWYTSNPSDTNRCYKDWFSYYPAAPEYFCVDFNLYSPVCSSYSIASTSVPKNYLGYQFPRDGSCYIGLILWDCLYKSTFGKKIKCGYTQVLSSKLKDTLRKNKIYEFKMYWSLVDGCMYSINQLQVYFTPTITPLILSAQDAENICQWFPKNYNSQISVDTSTFLSDTSTWNELKGCFKAIGNEIYISILNSRDTSETKISTLQSTTITCTNGITTCNPFNVPYIAYFIDDLSLYDRGYYGEDARARSDTLICPNVSVVLGNNDTSDARYQWFPPAFLNCDTCPNPVASPTITTTYVVKKFLCDYITYDTVTIYVAPTPTPVSIINDTTLCYPASLLLAPSDTTYNFTQYQWSPTDYLSCSNCPDPAFNPPDTGTYHYFFTQTFCNTKLLQDSVTIQVKFCNNNAELETPNIFTPNNDGINDEWFIHWKYDKNISNFNVEIYNRWGKKVFFSNDKNFRWDGKCIPDVDYIHLPDEQNNCPTGTYYYIIQYQINKEKKEMKGYVTLIK